MEQIRIFHFFEQICYTSASMHTKRLQALRSFRYIVVIWELCVSFPSHMASQA